MRAPLHLLDTAADTWKQDGAFVRPVRLVLGPTDGNNTQVLKGELNDGDALVVGENRSGGLASNEEHFAPAVRVGRGSDRMVPLVYDPLYWGMVFPLGMYTVCTLQLSKAISFEPLMLIPRYFVFVAMAAWLAVFIGLIHSLLTRRRSTASTVRNG